MLLHGRVYKQAIYLHTGCISVLISLLKKLGKTSKTALEGFHLIQVLEYLFFWLFAFASAAVFA